MVGYFDYIGSVISKVYMMTISHQLMLEVQFTYSILQHILLTPMLRMAMWGAEHNCNNTI